MLSLKQYHIIMKVCIALLIAGFFFYGNQPLFVTAYISAYVFVVLRALSITSKKRMKLLMIATYSILLILQLAFNKLIVFDNDSFGLKFYFDKIFSIISLLFPFVIERFFIVNKYASFYFPSVQEITTFSFNELKENMDKIISVIEDIKKAGNSLALENIEKIITDLPRHNSFRYINNGTLTDGYFETAYGSLTDPHIYIVISNTGSAAAEIISVFTKKQYNHASISFDSDLKTIISYNGGERLYPPGLNHEMIDYFNQKADSSIIVYRMDVTYEQKKMIIDKIKEINTEGSAYNVMGLILKYSHKANIMFCSQFVYKMLKYAGLQYFERNDGKVKPTDFVELDYYRKLQFAYEIFLNAK